MHYSFPTKDIFQAREVLEVDFDINNEYKELFVELEKARIHSKYQDYRNSIKKALNIENNQLKDFKQTYKKILFTGYRGSGKTTELYKIYKELDGAEKYFTIFVDLEKEFDMGGFRFEDFFFILIYKFYSEIEKIKGIEVSKNNLKDLLEDILSEKEIEKITEKSAKATLEASTGGGFNVFNIFKAKLDLKAEFAAGTSLAETIRKKIRINPLDIIRKFNNVIEVVRPVIIEEKKGKDILFVIDSLEKIDFDIYQKLIVRNSYVIRELQANLIIAIPISAKFLLNDLHDKNLFEDFTLPVIKVDNLENRKILAQIIEKRIDKNVFFENDEVLDYLVKMSGGVIRQLLKITAFNLLYASKTPLCMNDAEENTNEYGRQMAEALNEEQLKIMKAIKNKERSFLPAEKDDSILMQNLFILKYNGDFDINPVIKNFI